MTNVIQSPAIILIRPQMGENIGAVARAMKNFGLSELRIVAPRDGWPNPAAEAMSAGGEEIVKSAKLYATTADALADLHYVYASTARDRRLQKPQLEPRAAMAEVVGKIGQGQKLGILFGPERSGLDNEDVALAHAIITVPTSPDYPSLNLGQSAVVLGYEWWVARVESRESRIESDGQNMPATQEEIHGLFDHLEQALDKTYFFKRDEKKPRMWRNLRTTLLKAGFSSQEVHSLRGAIAALEKGWRK